MVLSNIYEFLVIMFFIFVLDELFVCFVLFCSFGWIYIEFIIWVFRRGFFFIGCFISKDERFILKERE